MIAEDNHRPALEFIEDTGDRVVCTYSQLSMRSDAVAAALADGADGGTPVGVRRGDRVLLVLGAQPELWECILALLKLGAVVIPVYPTITAVELADRVARGGIAHMVIRADRAADLTGAAAVTGRRVAVPGGVPGWEDYAALVEVPRPFVPTGPTLGNSVAFGYFTSGTTASPKLVGHTHVSYPVGHLSSLYWNGLQPGDRHLNVAAPGWAKHSWSSLFVPCNAEATVVVPADGPGLAARLPALLRDFAVTSCCAPPGFWAAMVPHLAAARPALREATSAGEPVDPAVVAAVADRWGVTVRDGYGQTEATAIVGTSPGMPHRPGMLGRPLPGYLVSLRDPVTGASNSAGELCVEPDPVTGLPLALMAGYLEDGPPCRPWRGYYRTGDLAERDADGWIRIVGRRDDVFKVAGHRVSPYELEAAFRDHPGVAEVAVAGTRDGSGDLVPHAYVVPRPGVPVDPPLLLAHARQRLAEEICPRSVTLVHRLPRTASGKVRRSALADASPNTAFAKEGHHDHHQPSGRAG